MFYFVVAEKNKRYLQQIFHLDEKHEMHCWMEVLAEYGWTVKMKCMNRNQKK